MNIDKQSSKLNSHQNTSSWPLKATSTTLTKPFKKMFEKKLGGVIFWGVSTRRGRPRGGGYRGRGLIKKEVDYLNTPLGQGPAN